MMLQLNEFSSDASKLELGFSNRFWLTKKLELSDFLYVDTEAFVQIQQGKKVNYLKIGQLIIRSH